MHLDAKDYPGPLDYASKLDRNPALIHALIRKGRERAAWFFDERSDWPREGTVPHRSVYATSPSAVSKDISTTERSSTDDSKAAPASASAGKP